MKSNKNSSIDNNNHNSNSNNNYNYWNISAHYVVKGNWELHNKIAVSCCN